MNKRKSWYGIATIGFCFMCILGIPFHVQAKANEQGTQSYANIVLFAEFQDTQGFFEDSANRQRVMDYYDGSSARSFSNYMKTISYGQFEVKNIFPQDNGSDIQAVVLPYTSEQAGSEDMDYEVINKTISEIPSISDQIIDYNGDGVIDNLTVVLAGKASNDGAVTPTLYPHKADYPGGTQYSGKYIGTYNMLSTGRLMPDSLPAGGSLIAHEFLHSIGYPDLYTQNGSSPVGPWDIMAQTSTYIQYPLAYLRAHVSNWMTIDTITESQTVTLNAQTIADGNQAYILRSPLNEHELFVIEFRKKTNFYDSESIDSKIGASGIIVYRVDTTVTGLSNYHGETGIYVFRPSGDYLNDNMALMDAALSVENNRTVLGSADMNATLTDGALTFSDGTNSGIVIDEVSSAAGDSMTCSVSIPNAEDYDLWEDMNFPDSSGDGYNSKYISMVSNNGTLYATACKNGMAQTYAYTEGLWSTVGEAIHADSMNALQLCSYQNEIYLGYISVENNYCVLHINKFNGSSWDNVMSLNNVNNFYLGETSHGLYLTYDDGNSGILKKYVAGSFEEVGSGVFFEGMCGQPKLVEANGNIYVSIRNASNANNLIQIYQVTENGFNDISNSLNQANTYDLKSDGQKLYVLLGGNNLILNTYDGEEWESSATLENAGVFQPFLSIEQGTVYALVAPNTDTGYTRVYRLSGDVWIQEGENVDACGENLSLCAIENGLALSYHRNVDDKLCVKKKTTQPDNVLQSITVTPPAKLYYLQNESTDLSGMQVVANYTQGSQNIDLVDCSIEGFVTDSIGNKIATVTYQGISSTFSFSVKQNGNEEIEQIPDVEYSTHVQNDGWQNYSKDGESAGTTGRRLRLEGIKIRIANTELEGGVTYSTHIENIGWQNEMSNNELSGTQGRGLRLEAIKMNLTGELADKYDIYYRVHAQNFGWLDWAKNDEKAGTAGYAYRLEAIQIVLVKKGEAAPGETNNCFRQTLVQYHVHCQDYGWLGNVVDGASSGTVGQAKRLEAIQITLPNQQYKGDIKYRTHIQNIGWESSWKSNGASSGTSGRGLRLEAIQIKLTEDIADKYDVYYRVHAQNFGWLGWAKNGEEAGTQGYGYRLEAIEIKIVRKGADAPGSTNNPFLRFNSWVSKLKISNTCSKLIVVNCYNTNYATVSMHTKSEDGYWSDDISVAGRTGRNGLSSNRHAGDLTTPTGAYTLGLAFGIADNPGCAVNYHKVTSYDYWGGANNQYYNMLFDSRYNHSSTSGAEHLINYTTAYQYCVDVGFNREQIYGKGSAIFLHCSTGGYNSRMYLSC